MLMDSKAVRAMVTELQKYGRLLPNGQLESREDIYQRVGRHQRWLRERQLGRPLNALEERELAILHQIQMERRGFLAGRVKWMGDTEKSREVEVTSFNCAGLQYETVYDVVDAYWLLLQGCGVSIRPQSGCLFGFAQPIPEIQVIHSNRVEKGNPKNVETLTDGVWTIKVGDSAVAWAKALGKLVAHEYEGTNIIAKKLILDFSEIRGKGQVTSGYGWRTSGDEKIARSFEIIAHLLNTKVGLALSVIDLLDIFALTGETLSSRRSAGLVMLSNTHTDIDQFMRVKRKFWEANKLWRGMTNNTVLFETRPTLSTLRELMHTILENGESGDPGLCNAEALWSRFEDAIVINPCGEQPLVNGGLCNQVVINVAQSSWRNLTELFDTAYYLSRAAYVQTCVDLRDGVLSERWHRNNQHYRLVGVGVMGVAESGLTPAQWRRLRAAATHGAHSMAKELGLPLPYYVTTVKPDGTAGKAAGVSEGLHHPLAKHIFNYQNFNSDDPVVSLLESHGYEVKPNPMTPGNVLVNFPIKWGNENFKWRMDSDGVEVERHGAIDQLENYRRMMDNWCDTNASCTITYLPDEIPSIADWLHKNWDSYVGTAFMPRFDLKSVTPGLYLPQTPVSEAAFNAYSTQLKPIDWERFNTRQGFDREAGIDNCDSGVCGLIS